MFDNTLLFSDYQLLIAQHYEDLEFIVRKLLDEYEKWGLKTNLEGNFDMGYGAETKCLLLEIRNVAP